MRLKRINQNQSVFFLTTGSVLITVESNTCNIISIKLYLFKVVIDLLMIENYLLKYSGDEDKKTQKSA